MHYLYRHIRLDSNEVFYIGIGTKPKSFKSIHIEFSRAYSKNTRSDFWKNIILKTPYEVEILFESDNYDFIKEKEIEFISLYGRRNLKQGSLVNLTDGGDGNLNSIVSIETKNKLSIARKNSKCIRGKKIYQYNIDGSFLKEWNNITSAAIYIDVNKSTLQKIATKNINNNYCKGYYWSSKLKDSIETKSYRLAIFAKIKMIDPLNNKIIQIFKSKEEALRFLGKKKSGTHITKSIRNNRLAYGYKWEEVKSCV